MYLAQKQGVKFPIISDLFLVFSEIFTIVFASKKLSFDIVLIFGLISIASQTVWSCDLWSSFVTPFVIWCTHHSSSVLVISELILESLLTYSCLTIITFEIVLWFIGLRIYFIYSQLIPSAFHHHQSMQLQSIQSPSLKQMLLGGPCIGTLCLKGSKCQGMPIWPLLTTSVNSHIFHACITVVDNQSWQNPI